MDGARSDVPSSEQPPVVRWLPSVLLDLPPGEPLVALRTPHRVTLQALPATREGLEALLSRPSFELVLELEGDDAPGARAVVLDVHEARITPDLALDWPQYYWLTDGLLDDIAETPTEASKAFLRGRSRLAMTEQLLRDACWEDGCDLFDLDAAWQLPRPLPNPDTERYGEPQQALQQYLRGLVGHLVDHASEPGFADEAQALLSLAEKRPDLPLPQLGVGDTRLLALYTQHRALGAACLTSPAGMIAGWHLLFSVQAVAVWWMGLLLRSKRKTRSRDALLHSLWLLDQGLWRDEPLVHDVLRHLNASEYTSFGLAVTLASALRGVHART
jgi:hypothetical protein